MDFLRRDNHRSLAAAIALAFFSLATIYSIVTPIFESPDELWHYPFVWHLARTSQLPVQDPARPQLWQQEGSQPPLYYALAALLTAPIAADDLPELIYPNPHADIGRVSADGNANIVVHTEREHWPWQGAVLAIHLARLFSVLLGTGTVLTIYALGRTLWPEQPALGLVAMAFVAFNPMVLFISASVNNDNLITCLAALTLWRLIALVANDKSEPTLWEFASLGLLTGLAALAKLSGLGLLGLVGLTLLAWGWRRRSWRTVILGNGLVGLLAVAIAGWWYGRNVQLYGDWTGTQIMVALMGPRSITPTPAQFIAELSGLVRSFWGLFGYFAVPLPPPIYWLFNLLLLAGLAGLLLALGRERTELPPALRRSWPILAGWLLLIAVGLLQWTLRTPATQGRLLFPGLAALAPLWAFGWLTLVSPRWQALPVLSMLAVAVWVPWGVIAPAYARPAPVSALPPSARPLAVRFGEAIQLLAYDTEFEQAHPGQSIPLTLYWSSDRPLDTDYTVFIHLLDEHDLIVAQRDVYHGLGLYPTSQWSPGRHFADTYVLSIPRTAFTPAHTRYAVGLYDQTTGRRLPVSTGGDSLHFGSLELEPLPHPTGLPNPQALIFEENIALVGYDLERQLVDPGQTVAVTLFWQSDQPPEHDYKVFVHLVGPGERRAAQHDSEPQNGAAPTSTWQPEQIIADKHPLTIGAEAGPDAYRVVVGLYDGQTGQRLRLLRNDGAWVQADSVTLGGVRVTSP